MVAALEEQRLFRLLRQPTDLAGKHSELCVFFTAFGVHTERETPVLIPNTEVKSFKVDGTRGDPGRVDRCREHFFEDVDKDDLSVVSVR